MPDQLTGYEIFFGVLAGLIRWVEAILWHEDDTDPNHVRAWSPASHVMGALAEIYVAKTLNRYWVPVAAHPTTLTTDVGRGNERIQVRATRLEHGKLVIRQKDEDDDLCVLCIGFRGRWRIAGWIYVRDGKKPEYWDETRLRVPAWMVPQDHLQEWA